MQESLKRTKPKKAPCSMLSEVVFWHRTSFSDIISFSDSRIWKKTNQLQKKKKAFYFSKVRILLLGILISKGFKNIMTHFWTVIHRLTTSLLIALGHSYKTDSSKVSFFHEEEAISIRLTCFELKAISLVMLIVTVFSTNSPIHIKNV